MNIKVLLGAARVGRNRGQPVWPREKGLANVGHITSTVTSSAMPSTNGINVQIGPTEQVATNTMCFICILIPMKTAPQILGKCYRLHMRRTNATRHTTEMINLQSIRDWAILLFVSPTVCSHLPPIVPEKTIALSILGRLPQPAAAQHAIRERPMIVDHGHESSLNRFTLTLVDSTRHGPIVPHAAPAAAGELASGAAVVTCNIQRILTLYNNERREGQSPHETTND